MVQLGAAVKQWLGQTRGAALACLDSAWMEVSRVGGDRPSARSSQRPPCWASAQDGQEWLEWLMMIAKVKARIKLFWLKLELSKQLRLVKGTEKAHGNEMNTVVHFSANPAHQGPSRSS